jgi:uncharacterized membrane protein YdbT with pleckstrin-like domain
MMHPMGLPKDLLGDDEELVMVIRPHVRVLAAPVIILILVAVAGGLLWSAVPEWSTQSWLRWGIVLLAAVVIVRWVVWPLVQWWSTVYAITTHRLVTRSGVISRSGHDMPLVRLNDVSFSHTLIQRMLGCGTIVAESGGERGQLVLRDIPDVEKVQRILYQLANDAHQGEYGASVEEERSPEVAAEAAADDDRFRDDRSGAGPTGHADEGVDGRA